MHNSSLTVVPHPTIDLSQQEIDAYRRDGFIVIHGFSTPEELALMQTIYDELFEKRAGREVGDEFDLAGADADDDRPVLPQILSPSKYAPELLQTLAVANARAIAKQVLGPAGEFGGDHAILKPAKYGAATPWHQDEAYWDPALDYDSFSIWLPLSGASVESGCLHFIPGSHLGEVIPHRPIGGDPRIHGLEAIAVDTSNAVAVPLEAGSVTVHHNRTLHYAGPNLTEQPRRAYILMCGKPATPRQTPRQFPWKEVQSTERSKRAESARNQGEYK